MHVDIRKEMCRGRNQLYTYVHVCVSFCVNLLFGKHIYHTILLKIKTMCNIPLSICYLCVFFIRFNFSPFFLFIIFVIFVSVFFFSFILVYLYMCWWKYMLHMYTYCTSMYIIKSNKPIRY